ncbi:MAG: transcription termination factor NusA [Bacteroidetes bacterium]|jgi:N utilization substance protein A|nr:transcription termination factor NusA [Bacteroidota bacterium]
MNTISLIDSFADFKEQKNIDRVTMMHILEDVIRGMIVRKYGEVDNFDLIVNVDKGDLEIFQNLTIVEDGQVEDPVTEIALTEALKIEPDFEVGEEVSVAVPFSNFGRRAITSMRQNLHARIQDLEKDAVYKKYKDRVGEILAGEVYQVWRKELLVLDDEGNELILPKAEMIPSDFFKKGETIRAVVLKVDLKNNSPLIILSRTAPEFLEKLFEQEVPEVFDGLITIKKIVRIPGERAKVAVESFDDRIDPVGACVGMKGSRIHGIVRELRNENIDVINYTNNTSLYIQRALSPAKVVTMELNDVDRRARVFLKPDQVSLAIGKGGMNIKLASRLTGYEIDVYRDDEPDMEDVALDDFRDEIEDWVIDTLKSVGCDTAKSVLELTKEDLLNRTDLEEETIDEVLQILKSEFEK